MHLGKSRSATVSPGTIVQDNDLIGRIKFLADDGNDMAHEVAWFGAYVDGTPGENDVPGRFVIATTADGAASATERMRIDSAGDIGIGGVTSPGAKVEIDGDILVRDGIPENAQTGTTYTLVIGDAGKEVSLNNASAIALTVPTNASVAFAIGTQILIRQKGAGQVTFGGTPTINNVDSHTKTKGQYAYVTLKKVATDTWDIFGSTA